MRVLNGPVRITLTPAMLVLAMLLAAGCPQSAPSDSAGTSIGSSAAPMPRPPAPDFSFTTLAGQQRSLADFSGRPLVVNFFATT